MDSNTMMQFATTVGSTISSLPILIFSIVGWCIVYSKTGGEAWIPIVPIYGNYYQFKKFWDTRQFLYLIFSVAVIFISGIIIGVGISMTSTFAIILGSTACVGAIIWMIVIGIMLNWNIAKRLDYNNRIPIFLALTFIQPIFILIYGILMKPQNQSSNGDWNKV